jgi:hypothetical protein
VDRAGDRLGRDFGARRRQNLDAFDDLGRELADREAGWRALAVDLDALDFIRPRLRFRRGCRIGGSGVGLV